MTEADVVPAAGVLVAMPPAPHPANSSVAMTVMKQRAGVKCMIESIAIGVPVCYSGSIHLVLEMTRDLAHGDVQV